MEDKFCIVWEVIVNGTLAISVIQLDHMVVMNLARLCRCDSSFEISFEMLGNNENTEKVHFGYIPILFNLNAF